MANTEKNYDLAKERVEKKMGFLIHSGIYVVVNAGQHDQPERKND